MSKFPLAIYMKECAIKIFLRLKSSLDVYTRQLHSKTTKQIAEGGGGGGGGGGYHLGLPFTEFTGRV